MYKIKETAGGFIIFIPTWYGSRKMRYKDYGATGSGVKVFKTKHKAEWAIKRYAEIRGV